VIDLLAAIFADQNYGKQTIRLQVLIIAEVLKQKAGRFLRSLPQG